VESHKGSIEMEELSAIALAVVFAATLLAIWMRELPV